VAEVLSSGPEAGAAGPRPPGPRWLSALALVAAGAVLAVLAVRDGTGRRPAPVAAPTSAPVVVEPWPSAVRTGPLPPEAVYRLDGDPGPGPPGVRLLVARRSDAAVMDAGSGRLTPVPGLRVDPGAAVDLRRRGALTTAVVFSHRDQSYRGWALPDGGHPVDLGRVQDVLPMRDGTVLTLVCVAGTGLGCVLGSRTATGQVRWQRRVPRELGLVRDTPYGLLTVIYLPERPGVLRLEDPRTGRVHLVLSRSGHPLAATDRLVAYQGADCDRGCPVVLVDLATGSRRNVPVPEGRAAVGAFAPDGDELAVAFQGLHTQDPFPAARRDGYVVLLDLRRGSWREVPGLTTGPKTTAAPLWTPDGTLLLGTGQDGAGRLASWRPGAPRVTVLPVWLTDFDPRPGSLLLLP